VNSPCMSANAKRGFSSPPKLLSGSVHLRNRTQCSEEEHHALAHIRPLVEGPDQIDFCRIHSGLIPPCRTALCLLKYMSLGNGGTVDGARPDRLQAVRFCKIRALYATEALTTYRSLVRGHVLNSESNKGVRKGKGRQCRDPAVVYRSGVCGTATTGRSPFNSTDWVTLPNTA
jgi:hypothetical protein